MAKVLIQRQCEKKSLTKTPNDGVDGSGKECKVRNKKNDERRMGNNNRGCAIADPVDF